MNEVKLENVNPVFFKRQRPSIRPLNEPNEWNLLKVSKYIATFIEASNQPH